MSAAPDPLDIFCRSLRHEGSIRVVLPDEADNPVSGEWIRAQMNEEVASELNKELLTNVHRTPSVSMYEDELIRRTKSQGGLLGDDRLYQAFQVWRQAALMKLWQILHLESTRPIHESLRPLQKELHKTHSLKASAVWLEKVIKVEEDQSTDWILATKNPYTSMLDSSLINPGKKFIANSLKIWIIKRISNRNCDWRRELVSRFPHSDWRAAVRVEQDYHRAYLASLLYEWAWPDREDPPATQPELLRLLTEGPLQAEIRPGEFGQSVDESWMQIVHYAVVDLPTGRVVRVLRPGLLVAGRVVRKAQVVISR